MIKETIGKDGRLHFPGKLLRELGYDVSREVIITTKGDEMIISKAVKTCLLCSEKENMIEGFPVCRDCAEKISDILKLS